MQLSALHAPLFKMRFDPSAHLVKAHPGLSLLRLGLITVSADFDATESVSLSL